MFSVWRWRLYKPVIANNFRSNSYIEYNGKGDRKTLSVEEYLNKIKSYLEDIINELKHSDTWKIQLTVTINFIFSKDDNDEVSEKDSKSDSIEITMNDEADKVIEKLFESLKKKISK